MSRRIIYGLENKMAIEMLYDYLCFIVANPNIFTKN